MIHILSWTTKKHKKNTFQAATCKVEENSRTSPKIQGLFKTVQALHMMNCSTKNHTSGIMKLCVSSTMCLLSIAF